MSCERPSGLAASLWRDSSIKFPPNWEGELPPAESEASLRERVTAAVTRRGLTAEQGEEAIRFFLAYEERYYEKTSEGQCYHRACDGGAVVQGELGIYCANCGKLPDLLPPAFMRY